MNVKNLCATMLMLLLAVAPLEAAKKELMLSSPDGKLEVTVALDAEISYSVKHDGRQILAPSALSMKLSTGDVWGKSPKLLSKKTSSAMQEIISPFYRSEKIVDNYNELALNFRGQWSVEFRAYNDGVAYRFVNKNASPFNVVSEKVDYAFTNDAVVTASYVDKKGGFKEQFFNSFENVYTTAKLSELDKQRLMMLPLVVNVGAGKKICIIESDLEAYPGLYLNSDSEENSLKGVFAPYPKTTKQGGYNMLEAVVEETEAFIAKVDRKRTFPWRGFVVSSQDIDLAKSNLVYALAAPSRVEDTAWVVPGKVAWEWWNDLNLEGVDFKTGVNNDTYKYYIDFAAAHGIEYVILDEGWSVKNKGDLMQIVPEIDLPLLVNYAGKKNVGIVLWAGYNAFNKDMEGICRHYAAMGIKGFKVDFMDRDDQQMVEFVHRASATAAKYKLVMDFHGMYKPCGLNRTYPNVLNFEGVFGLEQMKFRIHDMVTHDVTLPFIRQVAGPMDYTQGAMKNAAKGNSYACFSEPMSQGTRCRQLATYVVFDSPLNMLCDSPTNYIREKESLDFISGIPTVWDETVVLDGKLGEYIVTARRSKNTWYIGGLTNWDARDLKVDLSFLKEGDYEVILFKDGINADRKATDYARETLRLSDMKNQTIHLAPGGGFAIKIEKHRD